MLSSLESRFLLIARLALGWLMFYAGITKIVNPAWTAGGYLANAKTFPGFHLAAGWFSGPTGMNQMYGVFGADPSVTATGTGAPAGPSEVI